MPKMICTNSECFFEIEVSREIKEEIEKGECPECGRSGSIREVDETDFIEGD